MSHDARQPPRPPDSPVSEAELQAFVDGQLPLARQGEVQAYLDARPQELSRVEAYRVQKQDLRRLFAPVLDEAPPERLRQAAQARQRLATAWFDQRWVAGVAIALVSGAAGWGLHGSLGGGGRHELSAQVTPPAGAVIPVATPGFARRAAVAHAVYSPDLRRPVEIDAAHEDQLVAWLSKRMGTPMKPPHLQAQGYALEGGRLLPGGQGPVAQFMYSNAQGGKLTLYVSTDLQDLGGAGRQGDVAFRLVREGGVNVFYWVDGPLGYALSADADREVLTRVSTEVYQQLTRPAPTP
jgi:anti-sigma factor RsiW